MGGWGTGGPRDGLKERAPDISAREQGWKATGISASSAAWPFRGRVAEGKKLTGRVRLPVRRGGRASARLRAPTCGSGCAGREATRGGESLGCCVRERVGPRGSGPRGQAGWPEHGEGVGLRDGPLRRLGQAGSWFLPFPSGLRWVWVRVRFSIFPFSFLFLFLSKSNSNKV